MAQLETGPTSRMGALARALGMAVAERISEGLVAHGYNDVRLVHLAVFGAVLEGSTRITQIADRLGVTKQAVKPVVDALEAGGYVERIPDPADGRAKRLRITTRGAQAAVLAGRLADEIDRGWAAVVGPERLETCRATLWDLVASLHQVPQPDSN